MTDFFDQVYWNNTIKSYLLVFAVILFVLLMKRMLSRYLAELFYAFVHRGWKKLDKKAFIGLLIQPLGTFLVIFISIIALHKLYFPVPLEVEVYKYTSKQIIHAIGTIIMIIAFIWLLLRIIDFIAFVLEQKANLTPAHSDNQLIIFFKDFFKVLLVIIGILMVLNFAFDFNIRSLVTGLSIVGAAIALALRESLENLIASFIIFFDKPFTTGDDVKVQNITGKVETIGLRSTRIRTDQKTFVSVPNKQMVDNILDNLSLRNQRKVELHLHVSHQADASRLELLIQDIRDLLVRDPVSSSSVFLNDLTNQGYDVYAEYFTGMIPQADFNLLKQEINVSILRRMEAHEIEMASGNMRVQVTEMPKEKKA